MFRAGYLLFPFKESAVINHSTPTVTASSVPYCRNFPISLQCYFGSHKLGMKLRLLIHSKKLNKISRLFLKGSGGFQFQAPQWSGWKGTVSTVTTQGHSVFNPLAKNGLDQRPVNDALCKLLSCISLLHKATKPRFWSRDHYLSQLTPNYVLLKISFISWATKGKLLNSPQR